MKNYVTGWRQSVKKEVEKAIAGGEKPAAAVDTTAATKAEPARTTDTTAATKREAKHNAKPARRQAAAEGEVIDAEPMRRPARAVRMPAMRVPTLPMEWLAFLGFLVIFKISTDATYAAAQQIWPPGEVTWWHCAAAQGIISLIERFMFAGNVNWFTIIVLVADSLINAWGLVVDLLPNFFRSGLWGLLSGWNEGLRAFSYSQDTLAGLLIALAVGAFLAYSGDKLLDIAMRGR